MNRVQHLYNICFTHQYNAITEFLLYLDRSVSHMEGKKGCTTQPPPPLFNKWQKIYLWLKIQVCCMHDSLSAQTPVLCVTVVVFTNHVWGG